MRDVVKKINANQLKNELLREARVVKVPMGTAEVVAEKVAEQVEEWARKRSAMTRADIDRQIAKEIAKYSKDLAYVYQNRGKII